MVLFVAIPSVCQDNIRGIDDTLSHYDFTYIDLNRRKHNIFNLKCKQKATKPIILNKFQI